MTTYDTTDTDPRVQEALDRLDDLGPFADRADLIEVMKALPAKHPTRRVLAGYLDGAKCHFMRGSWRDAAYHGGWMMGHDAIYRPSVTLRGTPCATARS